MLTWRGATLSIENLAWFDGIDSKRFAFAFPITNLDLEKSLAKDGISKPLVVLQVDEEKILLSGHNRLATLRKIHFVEPVPVLLIPASRDSLPEIFALRLAARKITGPFNLIEKARAFSIALEALMVPRAELVKEWLPRLDCQPHEKILSQHLDLLRLPPAWQERLARDSASLKTAHVLIALGSNDLECLNEVAAEFRLGLNLLDEVANHLHVIARREGKTFHEILTAIGPLGASDDAPVKTQALRAALRKRAYPTLSEMEAAFRAETAALRLPSAVALEPPPYFEGDRFDIHFRFGSREELEKISRTLLEATAEPALKRLLELL